MTPFDTVEYLVVDVMSLSNNVVTAIKDAGVVTVADMLSLDDDTINDLDAEVTDPNDPTKFITVPLKKLEYSKLRRFGAFNMYLCNLHNVTVGLLDDSKYFNFTAADWITFTYIRFLLSLFKLLFLLLLFLRLYHRLHRIQRHRKNHLHMVLKRILTCTQHLKRHDIGIPGTENYKAKPNCMIVVMCLTPYMSPLLRMTLIYLNCRKSLCILYS